MPTKEAVASFDVRETTLLLNAAIVGDAMCLTLDRADIEETIWLSRCIDRADFDQNHTVVVAGPGFHDLDVGDEPLYLVAGYIDAPT